MKAYIGSKIVRAQGLRNTAFDVPIDDHLFQHDKPEPGSY